MVRPFCANHAGRFHKTSSAVRQTPAILISSMIGKRRIKTVQQISMRSVDLKPLETRLPGSNCRLAKRFANAFNFFYFQLVRHTPALCERDSAGSNDLPTTSLVGKRLVTLPRLRLRSLPSG